MAKPYKMPDPNDRSFNEPRVIIGPEGILKLYNMENEEQQKNVTEPVKNWFEKSAKSYGWDKAQFTGNQCTLEVIGMKDFHKVDNKDE